MSIDLLPADLLLKIFHQLPLKDRVRLAGVNRSFRNVSNESINKMKSLIVNDDVITLIAHKFQSVSSLLESCSLSLESIEATDHAFNKRNRWLPRLMSEFVYPKLKHLEIAVIDCAQTKKLFSRSQNLRSVILHLNSGFEWPENIVFEKLEKLEIQSLTDDIDYSTDREKYADLSTMLRPLIGKVPMLKHISIKSGRNANFIFAMEELNQLLASTPMIEVLILNLNFSTRDSPDSTIKISRAFQSCIPTCHLPKLTILTIKLGDWEAPNSSSILRKFPTLFPQLKSFTSDIIEQIDDGDFPPLSQLEHLRELRLRSLEMTKEKFTQLITSLPSIVVLEIRGLCGEDDYQNQNVDDQVLMALSRMENLRELCIWKDISRAEVVSMVKSVPSLEILKIWNIVDVRGPNSFNDFLRSTSQNFHRNLEIQLINVHVYIGYDEDIMDQIEACMDEVKGNAGTVVEMNRKEYLLEILSIRYKSLVE